LALARTIAVVALALTLAVLTFGGPIEHGLERKFWPSKERDPLDPSTSRKT